MDPVDTPLKNGDEPSQQLFQEARRQADSQQPNHDSPSRQLLYEFSRMLIDSDRKFHNELDRAAAEQEKKHLEALAAAAAEHNRVFRKNFVNETKRNPDLKKVAGDLRRHMRMKLGQLTLNPRENKDMLQSLRGCFTQAVNTPCFTVDVKQFLASPTQAQLPPGPCEISALLVFLFNHFAKAIVNQLASEAGVNIKAADPIGIVAVSVLGNPQFCINNKIPLTDILLAKYHKSCGVLFGIYGPEKTERGRTRLGWRQNEGRWCSDQDHLERMTGLGAGWASLALRKIKVGSALVHPLPNAHYWRAFSRIVNTPPHEATATHYMVLKAMVEGDSLDRFIQCYGRAAVAALRKGLIEFPQGHDSVAAKSLPGLVETIKKERKLTL
ncbi:putative rna export mediator gle1 protein [Neofusicoccum parvum UCRNP2]|uniref:mRNA export factor GLE1 n=1 Tax=Botryosphaeria parva (strain UCR-NP2) TaxID=1287680 RepID=R1H0D6_BOTPV|nr:putative rna export mediator gle1 protein [Neofusicoccum parvum UCRNP2]